MKDEIVAKNKTDLYIFVGGKTIGEKSVDKEINELRIFHGPNNMDATYWKALEHEG
jgi:hypothetical protein